jgi:hypothetical protein
MVGSSAPLDLLWQATAGNGNGSEKKTQRKKSKSSKAGNEESRDGAPPPVYLSLVFALTDLNLYVIQDNFSNLLKFVDAPIPIVRRIHPMESCR